jgi:agmatine deiminase
MAWRLPAEWEAQESVWLAWPRDPDTWPDRVDAARRVFVEAMKHIAPQPVNLLVHPELVAEASVAVAALDNVTLHACIHQDSWLRDYGPITLAHAGRHRSLKFRFDAWGGKYESLAKDNEVVGRLVASGALGAVEEIDFVLEGGAVETDGQGTFLTTRSVCEARGQEPSEFEAVLVKYMAAKHVVWLDDGIVGDDTDGHIDTVARFVAPRTVVVATAPDGHPDHAALARNLASLRGAVDALGRPLRVFPLPAAPLQHTDDGMPLPAGYANFLIANGVVLVPTFGSPLDQVAIDALRPHFPTRKVVGLDHTDLIWGMGGIHCLSMQIPKA